MNRQRRKAVFCAAAAGSMWGTIGLFVNLAGRYGIRSLEPVSYTHLDVYKRQGPDGLLAVTPPAMVSTALELPMKNIYFALVILFGCYVISYLFRIYLMFTKKEEV